MSIFIAIISWLRVLQNHKNAAKTTQIEEMIMTSSSKHVSLGYTKYKGNLKLIRPNKVQNTN